MVDIKREMRLVTKIIVHCSDTDLPQFDSIEWVRQLHKNKGWRDIGYHYFIDKKGKIFDGRPIEMAGAHCAGQNLTSIGICVSGKHEFYDTQFRQLNFLVHGLMKNFNISKANVFPHHFFNAYKTCPNFDIDKIWVYDK